MSLYNTFNISQQALLMNQSALNVVSNNIANMNTQGYSKQRVDQVNTGYTTIRGLNNNYQIGGGAQIGSIQRYRDSYLDSSYRQQSSNLSYYSSLYQNASAIENSLNELAGSGLSDAISQFFTAVGTLNSTPADSTARVNFIKKAEVVCTQFNQIAQTLTDGRTSAVGNTSDPQSIYNSKLYMNISELNTKMEQLAEINDNIVQSSVGNTVPNALLDQRDKLLDEISQLAPITVTENDNNSVSIDINGLSLVKGNKANKLDVTMGDDTNPTTIQLKDEDGNIINTNVNDKFTKGSIASFLEIGGDEAGVLSYQSMLDQIDILANEFAGAINGIQQFDDGAGKKAMAIGYDADGNQILSDYAGAGGLPPIFDSKTAGAPISALNMKVSDGIEADHWKVATARVDTTSADYDPKAVGNSENIKLMGQVRNNSIAGLNNMNPETFLTTSVTNMGSQIETIKFNYKSANSLYLSSNEERQSCIGVSLDEELVDLVKYQRAYEASARVFSVASSIMEQLVNLGR
ncbi:MAG: flagellar hook-associated protein FlgK [Candidatus Gastranaerophilales bacterium]|nr:flagellar hook-associated protein FlgK [Candidatus Gastranaerophilales bacterium]